MNEGISEKFIKCFLIHVFLPSWQHTHFSIQKISEISSITKQEARARARAQAENKGQVVAHTRTTPFYCIYLLSVVVLPTNLLGSLVWRHHNLFPRSSKRSRAVKFDAG